MTVREFVELMSYDIRIEDNYGEYLTQEEYVEKYGNEEVLGFYIVDTNVIGIYSRTE